MRKGGRKEGAKDKEGERERGRREKAAELEVGTDKRRVPPPELNADGSCAGRAYP